MNIHENLKSLFEERYSYTGLKNVKPREFKEYILARIGSIDPQIESYLDATKQRDLSLKFHWGHDHHFTDGFSLRGRMADRHIDIIAEFITEFGLETDLTGKKILDIGVWTGGTSLLLAALGGQVTAVEEVVKYAEMVDYLANAFGVEKNLRCCPKSLYDFLPQVSDEFDIVLYPGVVYHVTDPILSLRLIFTALKDRGRVFIDSFGNDSSESICVYEGPSVIHYGNIEELNRGEWNYFIPSVSCLKRWCEDVGFQEINLVKREENRITGVATRLYFQDFCRAGISKTSCR